VTTVPDEKLTGFALRLTLTGYVAIPRENEFDFLAGAEAAFAPTKAKNPLGVSNKGAAFAQHLYSPRELRSAGPFLPLHPSLGISQNK
jgi:hypothetical protein